jgi:hypothetical protein
MARNLQGHVAPGCSPTGSSFKFKVERVRSHGNGPFQKGHVGGPFRVQGGRTLPSRPLVTLSKVPFRFEATRAAPRTFCSHARCGSVCRFALLPCPFVSSPCAQARLDKPNWWSRVRVLTRLAKNADLTTRIPSSNSGAVRPPPGPRRHSPLAASEPSLSVGPPLSHARSRGRPPGATQSSGCACRRSSTGLQVRATGTQAGSASEANTSIGSADSRGLRDLASSGQMAAWHGPPFPRLARQLRFKLTARG